MRLSAEVKGLLRDGSIKGERVVPSSKGISKGMILKKDGKRQGNVLMTVLLKPIKDPARLQWHAVKKVDHYWLSIDAVTQPMQVREETIPYGDKGK